MLIVNGYETGTVLANFDSSDIAAVENFAKTELHKIIPKHEYNQYYGPLFSKIPQQYQIDSGHRNFIYKIRNYFRDNNKNSSNKSTMTESYVCQTDVETQTCYHNMNGSSSAPSQPKALNALEKERQASMEIIERTSEVTARKLEKSQIDLTSENSLILKH